jgi:5-methylcytosine-specific restriction endonuclease McrA
MTGHDETTTGTDAGFAERLLEVIDSGRRTATYKLALLLALVDLCARHSDHEGRSPSELHTRDLAEQVAELYWPQVAPFRVHRSPEALDLRQISNKRSTIIDALRSFRLESESSGANSLWLARQRLRASYEAVITRIERTLAEQPLPRLQTVGSSETVFPFLYDIDWGPNESFPVARLRGSGARGPTIRLFPGAGDELVRLSPLIRPLVELHWTRMVAQLNNVATVEEALRHHLFGSPRIPFSKMLRDGLADLQTGTCFYCGQRLVGATEVDHFIPRVRCGIDAIENLVLADRPCNGDKSDLLAAPSLVSTWARRNVESSGTLSIIAEMSRVDSDLTGTLAVARSIYGHLPREGTPLWQGRKQVLTLDPGLALEAMTFAS